MIMHTLTFDWSVEDMRNLAAFIAQLAREGVSYRMRSDAHGIEIEIMGVH